MRVAGYILTGMRQCRSRAHPPMILAHSLTSDFFGIEERAAAYPDFESFSVFPATAKAFDYLRGFDHLAGQNSVADLACWQDPATRRMILCLPEEKDKQGRAALQEVAE